MERGALSTLVAASLLAGCAHAGDTSPAVSLDRRIIVIGGEAGSAVAAYAVFANAGPETAVVEAQCDCAERIELHFVDRSNPGAGMSNSWPLALPAGSRTAIEPPGIPRHMMAVGLHGAIVAGEPVTIRFRLADGSWISGEFTPVVSSSEAWEEFDRQAAS